MVSIVAKDVSLVFPLVGSDRRFGARIVKRGEGLVPVGGEILRGKGRRGMGAGSGVRAIDNLSISLQRGDRLGIYGHNGAGKTTLLRVLAGIYPPSSGHISINGRVTGMFSLGLGINKEISGLENITLKGLMYGLRRAQIRELVPEIVEFSELGDYIHMPVKTYSSGMALRLQFSIASALRPDILLMDEWVSTADKHFKTKIDEKLTAMIDETPIVIIASHSEGRLASWASRLIVMEQGRIAEDRDTSGSVETGPFTPNDFKADPDAVKRYSQLVNSGQREAALAAIETVWPVTEDPEGYHSHRGSILMTLKRNTEAVTEYEKLLNLVQGNTKYHAQYGRVLAKTGAFEAAAKHLKIALSLSGGTVGSFEMLQYVLGEMGEKISLSELVERYLEEGPKSPDNLESSEFTQS